MMNHTMQAARLRLVDQEAYLSSVLFGLRPMEMSDRMYEWFKQKGLPPTMAVDAGMRLYYCPEFVDKIGVEQTTNVIIHEVHHVLREHAERVGDRAPLRWNVGADMEINDDLKKAGYELPEAVYPWSFKLPEGLTAEEYYEKLPKKGAGGDGGVGQGQCGGGAGNPFPWEEDPGEGAPPPVTPEDVDAIRRITAEAVKDETARGRGTIPAGLEAWAKKFTKPPQVPWQKVLKSWVRGKLATIAGCVDYSYSRPSRRQAALGPRAPVVPSMRQPVPNVLLVMDTSGSMLGNPLGTALNEVSGALKQLGVPIKAIPCDAAAYKPVTVRTAKEAWEKLRKGGGGTDMCVGIEAAARWRPDIIVCLTDAGTPWPAEGDPVLRKLVVVVVGECGVPDHIRHVRIKELSA